MSVFRPTSPLGIPRNGAGSAFPSRPPFGEDCGQTGSDAGSTHIPGDTPSLGPALFLGTPHHWDTPILGVTHPWGHLIHVVTPSLGMLHPCGRSILWVTPPWGHPCSHTPIASAPFCCGCFLRQPGPKAGLKAAAHGMVSCCVASLSHLPSHRHFVLFFFPFLSRTSLARMIAFQHRLINSHRQAGL